MMRPLEGREVIGIVNERMPEEVTEDLEQYLTLTTTELGS
jgi:hypothetical protein